MVLPRENEVIAMWFSKTYPNIEKKDLYTPVFQNRFGNKGRALWDFKSVIEAFEIVIFNGFVD